MTYANVNGALTPSKDAHISISDRGFRFGDGVFETIALHNGVPYQYEWHLKRLKRGLEALKINFDTSILQPFCRQLLHKNTAREGALRIQITRGNGSRGYLPAPENGQTTPCFVIETLPHFANLPQPASLWLGSYKKISANALPVSVKLCQGVNSTLARMEAQANGCFEALMLNEKNHICEASSSNIVWVKDDKIYTPALACGLLEGSTRAALIRLFDIIETEASIETLLEATSVMLTNSSWGVLPVSGLHPTNHTWTNHSHTQAMQRRLAEDRDRESRENTPMWLIQ